MKIWSSSELRCVNGDDDDDDDDDYDYDYDYDKDDNDDGKEHNANTTYVWASSWVTTIALPRPMSLERAAPNVLRQVDPKLAIPKRSNDMT